MPAAQKKSAIWGTGEYHHVAMMRMISGFSKLFGRGGRLLIFVLFFFF